MTVPMDQESSPPRLQLQLNASTTSFKRTFEDLGLELDDEPSSATSGTHGSRRSTFGRPSEDSSTSRSPSSTRSNKRARSEDLEGGNSSSGASGSGTHHRDPSLNVELRPIESISPILDSFSLPWGNTSASESRPAVHMNHVDTGMTDVDVEMETLSALPYQGTASVAATPNIRGTPLRLQSNFSALPFHEPPSPQPPQFSQHSTPQHLAGEEISRSSSATGSSSAASLHTLGLPEQDFFGPGSLRSTTPPWLRGRPILPMPTLGTAPAPRPLSAFLGNIDNVVDGNLLLPDIFTHPDEALTRNTESAPTSPRPRPRESDVGRRTYREPDIRADFSTRLPPIPIGEALTLDTPSLLNSFPLPAPRADTMEMAMPMPPLTRVLQPQSTSTAPSAFTASASASASAGPGMPRPMLYSRRSSSSLGFHRSSLESLLTSNATPQLPERFYHPRPNPISTHGTDSSPANNERTDSPILPFPPAPRAGSSYRFDTGAGEWVPGQPMPLPSLQNSPHVRTGSVRGAPRLGFLELVPSPSPSYSSRRWNRFIASPVGDDVSVGPSTPGEEREREWNDNMMPTPWRARVVEAAPSAADAPWDAPLLRAPPSGDEYRNREPFMPLPLSLPTSVESVLSGSHVPTGPGAHRTRRSASPIGVEHRSPDQPPQLPLPSLRDSQPLVDLSSPAFAYQEITPQPSVTNPIESGAPPPIESYFPRVDTPIPPEESEEEEHEQSTQPFPSLSLPFPRVSNPTPGHEGRDPFFDRLFGLPSIPQPNRRDHPAQFDIPNMNALPLHTPSHRTLLDVDRERRRRGIQLLTPIHQNRSIPSSEERNREPRSRDRSGEFAARMRAIFNEAAAPLEENTNANPSTVSNSSRSPPLDLHLEGFNASFDEDLGGYFSGGGGSSNVDNGQGTPSEQVRSGEASDDEEGSISSTRAVTSLTRPRNDIEEHELSSDGTAPDLVDISMSNPLFPEEPQRGRDEWHPRRLRYLRPRANSNVAEYEGSPERNERPARPERPRQPPSAFHSRPEFTNATESNRNPGVLQTVPRLSLPRFPSLMEYTSNFNNSASRTPSGSNTPREEQPSTGPTRLHHQRSTSLTRPQPSTGTSFESPRPRIGDGVSFLRPFSRGVRTRNDSLDSAIPRPRWTPVHRSGGSTTDIHARPSPSGPFDDLHLPFSRPSASRTSSTRGEASGSTSGSPPGTSAGTNASNDVGRIPPFDAVSQERNRLHALMMRRARGQALRTADDHHLHDRERNRRETRWGNASHEPLLTPLGTPHRRDPSAAQRTPPTSRIPAHDEFANWFPFSYSSLRENRTHRRNPSNPSQTNTGPTGTDPSRTATQAHENNDSTNTGLARSFSSMDEFFRDFDRRNGTNAFTATPPGATGLGAESYVPWRHPVGDFIMDDEFDDSYDGLLRLGVLLGEVKGRGTPQEVVDALPTATYKEWSNAQDCETRCPICLDDYEHDDPTRRLPECNHWFHRDCINTWLKSARTCPVCRHALKVPRAHNNITNPHRRRPNGGPGGGTGRSTHLPSDLLSSWTFGPTLSP